MATPLRVLLIDNYDSYTYNIVQCVAGLNGDTCPTVIRSDSDPLDDEFLDSFDCVIISPGPGHPSVKKDFGICDDVIRRCPMPLLGVCLGHQGLAVVHGGKVVHAPEPVHGHVHNVYHARGSSGEFPARTAESDLFSGIPSPFGVVRYHSLVVAQPELPSCLVVTARTGDGLIMALQHRDRPQYGVQFHPESICTEHGSRLLGNFLSIAYRFRAERGISASPGRPEEQSVCPTRAKPTLRLLVREAPWVDPEELFKARFSAAHVSFWLDSALADPARGGRFSFLGAGGGPLSALAAFRTRAVTVPELHTQRPAVGIDGPWKDESDRWDSIFSFLQHSLNDSTADVSAAVDLPFPFRLGWVGIFGYELRRHCGSTATAALSPPGTPLHCTEDAVTRCLPDAAWLFADRCVAFDVVDRRIWLLALVPADDSDGAIVEEQQLWLKEIALAALSLQPAKPNGSGMPCVPCPDRGAAQRQPVARPHVHQPEVAIDPSARGIGAAGAAQAAPSMASVEGDFDAAGLTFRLRRARETYEANVVDILGALRDGESYEACLTTALVTDHVPTAPLDLYCALRRANAAPYAALFHLGAGPVTAAPAAAEGPHGWCPFTVLSVSPERFLAVDAAGKAESKPIKGTRPRGATPAEDEALREDLRTSPKDRAENLMVLDLVRNDMGTVCRPGSVTVPALMQVETYATVHQLVSTVRGTLAAGRSALDCIVRAFPAGSMTGAPKHRTMALLHSWEQGVPRTLYSGALGFLSVDGAASLSVVIRTAVITPCGTTIGAGGAVVAQSDPAEEFDEMTLKARSLVNVIARHAGAPPQARVFVAGAGFLAAAGPAQGPLARPFCVLETLLWRPDAGYALLDSHVDRMVATACYFRFTCVASAAGPLQLRRSILAALSAQTVWDVPTTVRLLLHPGGALQREAAPKPASPRCPAVSLATRPVSRTSIWRRHKTTHRSEYDEARVAAGVGEKVFDVVLWNEMGHVTETSIANVAIENTHSCWRTPPLGDGLLAGAMRAHLLEHGFDDGAMLIEATVTVDDLRKASRIRCFNSVRGVYDVQLLPEISVGG